AAGPYSVAAAHLVLRSGNEARQSVEQTTVLGFKVIDTKADGQTTLEVWIDTLKIVNSYEETAKAVANLFKDVKFTVTLGPTMEVVRLEGFGEWLMKKAGDKEVVNRQWNILLLSLGSEQPHWLPVLAYKTPERRRLEVMTSALTED